mmetsp:Transcript_11994/g.35071  ORF Transcript_11994/g.35071 Transcript_11994/m.35071 type:complete len:218 (+) Transcript_11994:460-1113(+)
MITIQVCGFCAWIDFTCRRRQCIEMGSISCQSFFSPSKHLKCVDQCWSSLNHVANIVMLLKLASRERSDTFIGCLENAHPAPCWHLTFRSLIIRKPSAPHPSQPSSAKSQLLQPILPKRLVFRCWKYLVSSQIGTLLGVYSTFHFAGTRGTLYPSLRSAMCNWSTQVIQTKLLEPTAYSPMLWPTLIWPSTCSTNSSALKSGASLLATSRRTTFSHT